MNKIVPVCIPCWMTHNKGKVCNLPRQDGPRVEHKCHFCGFLTAAGKTARLPDTKEDAWKLFKAAIFILVLPLLIIYLKDRMR